MTNIQESEGQHLKTDVNGRVRSQRHDNKPRIKYPEMAHHALNRKDVNKPRSVHSVNTISTILVEVLSLWCTGFSLPNPVLYSGTAAFPIPLPEDSLRYQHKSILRHHPRPSYYSFAGIIV